MRDEAEYKGDREAVGLGARRCRDAVGVKVRLTEDPAEFLAEAGPFLTEQEGRNNLILGISGTLVEAPDRYPSKRFWIVSDSGRTVAAALRTPPYNLVLAGPSDPAALAALAAGIEEGLPGIVGAHPEVDEFTRLWAERHAVDPNVVREQGVYALERVQPVPATSGGSRPARAGDEALLLDWMVAFADEVLEENDPGRHEAQNIVAQRLNARDGGFVVWEDEGRVVSISGWGGPTPNGIRIGPVYTPPELRGRGYATALVAELSQTLLDGGRRFCFLFTDLANPTSNAIYERIGYVKVAESATISFAPVDKI